LHGLGCLLQNWCRLHLWDSLVPFNMKNTEGNLNFLGLQEGVPSPRTMNIGTSLGDNHLQTTISFNMGHQFAFVQIGHTTSAEHLTSLRCASTLAMLFHGGVNRGRQSLSQLCRKKSTCSAPTSDMFQYFPLTMGSTPSLPVKTWQVGLTLLQK